MKPNAHTNLDRILRKYRENLARYEAQGDTEKAAIQRRLIKRMEEST